MPKLPVFGYQEALKAVQILGFVVDFGRGKGSHSLAEHPTRKPIVVRQRPCITIPHWKEYSDPNFRSKFVNEIRAFGFTKNEVIDALNGVEK